MATPDGQRIRWYGLSELKQWLRALPMELTDDARAIVMHAVESARVDIDAAYAAHSRSGNLRAGLKVRTIDSYSGKSHALAVGSLLYNNAPHAYIFEHGSVARHNGIRAVGMMPAHNLFIPRAIRHREQMYDELAAMMQRHGLTVTGHAA